MLESGALLLLAQPALWHEAGADTEEHVTQAIISDVHSNLEAFEAVLADLEEQGATSIICLGDLIGYGPNPKECLDMAFDFDVVILGNHEAALLVQTEGMVFNIRARGAVNWTRAQLDMLSEDREANAKRWDFVGSLDETYTADGILHVHGTPRDPTGEYLYPRDIWRPDKLIEIFSMFEWVCMLGHTHVPGVWTDETTYHPVEELDYEYRLPADGKTIINVGSVGQPRDGDPRACYVLRDGDTVRFRKVKYPVLETATKIANIPELDRTLAERLIEGR